MARGRIYSPLLKELGSLPEVTEDDNVLIEQYKAGDENAGFKLLVKHYKMVVKVILDITRGRWYDDDCLHAGAIGLYEAARRFDDTLGYTFLTYAVYYIKKYVFLEVCGDSLSMGGIAFGRDFRERLYRYIGYKMTGAKDEDIAEKMDVSPREIDKLSKAAKFASRPVSLTSIRNKEEEDQADYDMEGVPFIPSAEEEVIDELFQQEIEDIVATLPEKHQFILNHTLGLNGCDVYEKQEIAEAMEISISELSTLRRKAYKDLKAKLRTQPHEQ